MSNGQKPETEYLKVNGEHYEITGYAPDGLPIIKGVATTTENGVDKDGHPVRSVNIAVPPILVGLAPGEIK